MRSVRRGILGVVTVVCGLVLAAASASASVLVIGDSLGEGTDPALRTALPGVEIESDNRSGRPSAEGLGVLSELLHPEHEVVVLDLGTNDSPAQSEALFANLAAARELAAGRCLVVATLNRPPVGGVPIDGNNEAIRGFVAQTPNALLVDWNQAAREQPGLLFDGIHATGAGYALRGQLFASAVQGCLTGGGSAASLGGAGGAPPPAVRRPPPLTPLERASRSFVPLLLARLSTPDRPAELTAKAGSFVADAATSLREALTPRGEEPVLGTPDGAP